jgi:hypothetical protein
MTDTTLEATSSPGSIRYGFATRLISTDPGCLELAKRIPH